MAEPEHVAALRELRADLVKHRDGAAADYVRRAPEHRNEADAGATVRALERWQAGIDLVDRILKAEKALPAGAAFGTWV